MSNDTDAISSNQDHPETESVKHAAARIGISAALTYRGCAKGEIPHVRVGGRILVLTGPLDSLLRGEA